MICKFAFNSCISVIFLPMFHKTTFPHGLRLITVPKKGAESVTMFILVRAGSKYENKEQNGISHFLEHLLFKGTKKRSSQEIAIIIDRIGGVANAFTSQEYTGYWVKAIPEQFSTVADLLSDIFLNARLAPREIEKERGVILEEIKLYNDIPIEKIGDIFNGLLYGDQPAGWDVLGRPEVIRSLKQKDFFNYVQKHYVAPNTTIVVAGDIDLSAVKKEITKRFAQIKRGTATKFAPTKENQTDPQIKIAHKDTDQTHLALGVRTFSIFDERRFALEVLKTILGEGSSSRLFQEIRNRRGAAYYIRTEAHLTSDAGFLVSTAGIAHSRLHEVASAILKEYKRISTKAPGKDELKKAQERIIGSLWLRLETSDDLAAYIGGQEIITGKIMRPEEYARKIKQVSADDVLKVGRSIMTPSRLNIAIIGPDEKGLARRLERNLAQGLR